MNAREVIANYIEGFESGELSWDMAEVEDVKLVADILNKFKVYLKYKEEDFITADCVSFCSALRITLLIMRMGKGILGKFNSTQSRIISEQNAIIQTLTHENKSLKDKNSSMIEVIEKLEMEKKIVDESKLKTSGVE